MERFDDVLQIEGQIVIPARTPVPPFRWPDLFLLGTDQVGRDLLSRILWGVRPTLLLCVGVVAVRMLIGLPLGLLAGWTANWSTRLIDVAIGLCLSVPTLVFAVAVASFLGLAKGLVVFIVALCVTGWADTATFIRGRTLSLKQRPFIESARATGLTSRRILGRYVLPQLWPVLPSLIAFELSSVLLLVTELGFLGIYIGGGFMYEVAKGGSLDSWDILGAGYPELGQMLSKVWAKLIMTPWEPLIVGTVVFVMIFAFNLLGEGLRRHMDITRI
jgi:ABC-type dipeptide/oligopeptide/nickel transport system permease subunit